MELATVGIIEAWQSPNSNNDSLSSEYFTTMELELKPIADILREWGERISFIAEKQHLKLLWNRNKKYAPYHY